MKNVLYLHGQGCGGDTISLLNAEEPDFLSALEILGLNIVFHPSLSFAHGDEVVKLLDAFVSGRKKLDIFIMEGSIPTAPDGTGGIYPFLERPFLEWVRELARRAEYTVAVGTCAANGGIPGSLGNPTRAMGLQFRRDKPGGVLGEDYRSGGGLPVINISGCPAHPDWILETLTLIVRGKLTADSLDFANRVPHIYGNLAHHACPRNEFYEFKASAEAFGQMGCLFENLGCRGTQCESDCNLRLWMGRTGSCTRAGYPCIACTSQDFPKPELPYFRTTMVAGVPRFLPRDVPKSWYVGLVRLSKMATPDRLRVNALSSHIVNKADENE